MIAPFLLRPDNFTPQARTPWGGHKLGRLYKGLSKETVIGESWELSVEPDFPSVTDAGESLETILAKDAGAMLGTEYARGRTSTALLVKLLDAADDLSVQIHPSDDYPGLAPLESGKPESWYVLERERGAGIYFGLATGVTREMLARAIENGDDCSKLLAFVEVEPGDFFLIDAGTAHAIGKGVTLVEPQHVAPGKRGITYRYWDWNRRYDAAGQPSPAGKQRALHVENALAVTAWDAPRERGLLEGKRLRAGSPELDASASVRALAGQGGLAWPWLGVSRVSGTGPLVLDDPNALRSLTVVEGSIALVGVWGELVVGTGRTAVLPAALRGVRATLDRAHALVCHVA